MMTLDFKNIKDIDFSFADEGRFIFTFNDNTEWYTSLNSSVSSPEEVIKYLNFVSPVILFGDYDDKETKLNQDIINILIEGIKENYEI